MKMLCLGAAAAALLAAQLATAATPPAVVEAVQMPAWVERGSERIPLAPGMALQDRDQLRTGVNSKLLLKMAEGSLVRLGENGTLKLDRMGQGRDNVFSAALNVFEGAFRFTTVALRAQRRRNINITIATVTAGIRGTDVWGKAASDKDIVCLIEGKIDVTGNDGRTLRLDQERQLFQSSRDIPPEPLGFVDPQQLAAWSAETEIDAGSGSKAGAAWKLVIAGFASHGEAREALRRLRADGYPATIAAGNKLVIDRLKTERAGQEMAGQWREVFAGKEIRVTR